MKPRTPHFLLFSESRPKENQKNEPTGQWRFVLEAVDGSSKVEAADKEPQTSGERLDLLAVVRGLEALDQPSRVTLVTPSRYVSRGLRHGLQEWRENGFQWERFGQMAPIKNGDLWQRIDRALEFHQVECRTWRFDPPEESPTSPAINSAEQKTTPAVEPKASTFFRRIAKFGEKLGRRFSTGIGSATNHSAADDSVCDDVATDDSASDHLSGGDLAANNLFSGRSIASTTQTSQETTTCNRY